MKFSDLKIIKPLLMAVDDQGYEEPTPIQVKAIPHLLKGRDLLGCAQTGTGKTAAFALPIIQNLVADKIEPNQKQPRVLVLAPTRELATQIFENFELFTKNTELSGVVVYGGVSQRPQAAALRKGVDYVIATPGRLLDLMNQGLLRLNGIKVLVLDEADRMLDMGFIDDIKKILKQLPRKRQTMLFSATLPPAIVRFASTIMRDPVSVEVSPEMPTVELIDQKIYFVEKDDKIELLKHLVDDPDFFRVLVFCDTKFTADIVEWKLNESTPGPDKGKKKRRSKFKRAEALHSDKTQKMRERVLDGFKKGEIQVLVATDIAARGIDIEEVDHVINFDFPNEPEVYIHRIGRTGRAGTEGTSITFCTWRDRDMLKKVERLIKMKIEVVEEHPYKSKVPPPDSIPRSRRRRR